MPMTLLPLVASITVVLMMVTARMRKIHLVGHGRMNSMLQQATISP